MMQESAIVQDSDHRDEGCAQINSDHLRKRGAVQRNEKRDQDSEVYGDAAQERHGLNVDLARTGMVHHSRAQGQLPHRNREAERGDQSDSKRKQA